MLTDYVKVLVNEGFAIVPSHIHTIPVTLIEEAMESSERVIRFWSTLKSEVRLCREGEEEPDVGLIDTRNDPKRDLKFFLHVTTDLYDLLARESELATALMSCNKDMDTLLRLHNYLNDFNLKLFSEMVDVLPELLRSKNIVADFKRSFTDPSPGGTTVLRGLWYPNVQGQVGAMPHFDIGFITNHLGDEGGSLLAHKALAPEPTENISPKRSEILVFPGLKALVVSQGRLVPLYHSASVSSGEDRKALVQFNHISCPSVTQGSGKKHKDIFASVLIDNPATWYQEAKAKM